MTLLIPNVGPTVVLLAAMLASRAASTTSAAEPPNPQRANTDRTDLDELAGQPIDIAPWGYVWRADLAAQAQPEAYFIPRRLERLDRIYRTARQALPESELKSIYYQMPDLLKPFPPKPKGQLLAGLLWTGRLADYQVKLHWPVNVQTMPPPEAVEVRVYPTSYGWFGWTVDRILAKPELSADRHTWTYKSEPGAKMDFAYSTQVDAATEMVAVFCEVEPTQGSPRAAVPSIRVTSPEVGAWQRIDLEIEWGFREGTEKADFDGRVESHVGIIGSVSPLSQDKSTTVTGTESWQSRGGAGGARRGILVPMLYAPAGRPALDTRVTVWTRTTGFTFRPRDTENGPILIPEHGVFVTKAGSGRTAKEFVRELAAKNLKSICQMTREHREAASWDEVMREVRLWTCPPGTAIPPLPKVEDPPVQVHLPDPGWTDAWRAGSFQLKGKHMWGGLAFEVARVAHGMDLVGLHEEADKVYQHFLKGPGVKSDGDYTDGHGALEWASSMRHDMGYSHDGTHASTGRLLFGMADRFFLTGDKAWFVRNRVRMQAAADWIIRQRALYMKDIPNRRNLLVAGLMPPCMLGDYAIPTCDWHWYYCDNAFALQGLQRFADALAGLDPPAARAYLDEAAAFRSDLRRVVDRDAVLSPVRLGLDGMYHHYIPRMPYTHGLTGPELGAPQFPDCDIWMGALPLVEPFAAVEADDRRMVDTVSIMEEMGTSARAVGELEEARKKQGLCTDDAWFWKSYVILPKASHTANAYLLQDDVPNFLRFWMNSYAAVVGADGKLWEHWHLGGYTNCEAPDNGTAGWFMENFRNLLVMEDGPYLWIARATPRAWLEQGKRVAVRNAPTCFGPLAYEIVSDTDNGRITATVDLPNRSSPQRVFLRFRHPKAFPIQGVQVNGEPWSRFSKEKETVELTGLAGRVSVAIRY
ncbi:MAG TPA: hypothetical protein PKY77_18585 [Phycisphaerae bacterium]|nr:hypothetical protein [Phycisphaerae bacterium]HRY69134.1 hypothetical protein [Phycisphaerae bacterium]HSA26095.1 hypothetical protein [Phycisphaerae bacterium]